MRHNHAAGNARNDSTDRYPVRDDKMFEVDECSHNQKRSEEPVRDCRLPWKTLPDRQKQHAGDQFDGEIAKSDFPTAIRTAAAEQDPADQRQILMPRNRLFARRAKRAARLVNRKIGRPAVNADVQERSDRRAQYKRKHAEQKLVNRMMIHAVKWHSISKRGVPSAMRSRCSFRKAGTLAAPLRLASKYPELE